MLEKLILASSPGIRFWDEVSASTLIDGLSVTVYPQNQPRQRVRAFMTPHGVYALRNLPGMSTLEGDMEDANLQNRAATKPATKPFIVEVVDTWREARFLPFLFPLLLPYQGLYRWESATDTPTSDIRKEAAVPLYSAPTRSVAAGMAVLRAELQEATTGKAASWAVLEAQLPVPPGNPPVTVRGLADQQGRVTLIFPYPMPVKDTPTAPDTPLEWQQWQIPLQAKYMPLQTRQMLSVGTNIPDLSEILKQPVAHLWENFAGQQAFSSTLLQFGREAIARSQDLSVLLITTAN